MSVHFWNKLSKTYDQKARDEAYLKIIEKSKKYLEQDQRVLDFGCATGLYTIPFSKYVGEIHGIDTSDEMIRIAESKAKDGEINKVSFSKTTIYDDALRKGGFQVVLAFNILLYFENIEEILSLIGEVMESGGTVIFATACLKERRTTLGVVSAIVIYLLKKIKVLPYIKFLSIAELEHVIQISGFEIVESEILIDVPATEYYIVAKKQQVS